MGRCATCRSDTQHFCFVHQEFVCDACLVQHPKNRHVLCPVHTYRAFLQDSTFPKNPICPTCKLPLTVVSDPIRRVCLHLECAACVSNPSRKPNIPCAVCRMPLFPLNLSNSVIFNALRARFDSPLPPVLPDLDNANTSSSLSKTHMVTNAQIPSSIVLPTSPAISTSPISATSPMTKSDKPPISIVKTVVRDACINLGPPPPPPPQTRRHRKALALTWHACINLTTTIAHRVIKYLSRRLRATRKLQLPRGRWILLVTFVASIVLLLLLMSGDDNNQRSPSVTHANAVHDSIPHSASQRLDVEDVTLPHVRVGRAFAGSKWRVDDDALAEAVGRQPRIEPD